MVNDAEPKSRHRDGVESMKKGLLNEAGEQVGDDEAGGRGRQASWSE